MGKKITIHHIKKECGGQNDSYWTQLKCSCGYTSEKVYTYQDFQRTILRNLEREHLGL